MKNLLKILPWLGIAGCAWSFGFFYNVYFGSQTHWLRATYQNKAALAAQLEGSKRLIITGGSGVHYTLNSMVIEQELGIPVFNFGLNGDLGLNVIFLTILEQVRPGDIVLIIPEYPMLFDEDGLGIRSTSFGVSIGKPGLGGVPPKQFAEETFLLGIPSLRNLTKSTIDIVRKAKDPDYIPDYYADPITDRGDPTKTWGRKSEWWQMRIKKSITPNSIAQIKLFQEEIEGKGATLLISLPIVYASKDEKTIKNVEKISEELSKIAPTIYDKESLNLWNDSNLFADTHYHLKEEGRVIRSKELIEQLQPIINK